jgi:serine/threonine-protein kinase
MDREALAIFEQWYGPDHPETGSAAMILAQPLMQQGRLDEAAALFDRARGVFERAYPEPHRRVGLIYNEIGVLATRRKRYDEAIAALTRSLEVYRQVYPDGRSQYISVGLSNLGIAYLEKGDHGRAEALLREAVSLSTAILTRNHTNTAIAEVKLGRALVRDHRYAEALPYLEEGYATLLKFSAPSSAWVKASLQELAAAYDGMGRSGDADAARAKMDK